MDTDILKPDTGALTIERPMHVSSKGTSASEQRSSGVTTPENVRVAYTEPLSEGEEDEERELLPGKLHCPFLTCLLYKVLNVH